MNLTKHAQMRKQQRGFTNSSMDIILRYGTQRVVPGGAVEILLSRREHQKIIDELRRAIQQVERAKKGHLIVKDGIIITAYK